MDLRQRVLEIIQEEWAKTRPLAVVGTTHSEDVYDRLLAERWTVPEWEMYEILEDLHDEGQIRGSSMTNREARRVHGARPIHEPLWHADLMRETEEE